MNVNEGYSLRSSTVMAMKIIREEVMRTSGTENVNITHELLVKCRKARSAYLDGLKEEQDVKRNKSYRSRTGIEEIETVRERKGCLVKRKFGSIDSKQKDHQKP